MNEILTALEAMMRRIVQEELQAKQLTVPSYTDDAFRASLKAFADTNKAGFAALISQGALDMPWFDDAIKSEAAAAVDATLPAGFSFASKDAFDQYVKAMVEPIIGGTAQNGGYNFSAKRDFENAVADVVQNRDDISDWFGDSFNNCIERVDFSCDVSVR